MVTSTVDAALTASTSDRSARTAGATSMSRSAAPSIANAAAELGALPSVKRHGCRFQMYSIRVAAAVSSTIAAHNEAAPRRVFEMSDRRARRIDVPRRIDRAAVLGAIPGNQGSGCTSCGTPNHQLASVAAPTITDNVAPALLTRCGHCVGPRQRFTFAIPETSLQDAATANCRGKNDALTGRQIG